MLCRAGEQFNWEELLPMFQEKCRIRNVRPNLAAITSADIRDFNRNVWRDRLGPMLNELPDFDVVWKEWTDTFQKLIGKKK